MKVAIIIGFVLVMGGCSALSPVYQFYAHKHAVPMVGADYTNIPNQGPVTEVLYNPQYALLSQHALTTLEAHRQTIFSPGISAAVAIDGELVWAGTAGWSNVERQQPLSVNSQFRIGSTSKALNAVLLARMVDAGLLSLDDSLSDYQVGQRNAQWHGITPRQLASHMAGLPHYKHNTDWRGLYRSIALQTHFDDVDDAVGMFDGSDLLFQPGDAFSYSSYGTVLLSAVMQEAANKPYQQAMQDYVLTPLGLQHTLPEPAPELRSNEVPNAATFYWHPDPQGARVAEWREVDLSHRLAGGGFLSTSSDLARLGVGFLQNDFVSAPVRQAFWTPQRLNNGTENEQGYAIGWRVRESDFGAQLGKLWHANHGGVSRGAQSWLMVIPEYRMAVAVNINAKTPEFWSFGKVSFELVKLFLTHHQNLGAEPSLK